MKMGQNSSVPLGTRGGRRKSLREAWRSPFPRRSQTHQGTLSATFHFVDDDKHIEQLNVNTASEEELMTLPGIPRNIAQNIVEYRQTIGGFKKVEDLALVSGIGAEKLDLIRPEICVSRRKNASCTSSRAQSYDSLPSTESTQYSRLGIKHSPSLYGRVVNVNCASVFELMAVHGLNQELAANIVDHRERRGAFHNIEELIKVKGINQIRLGALRSQLTVEISSEEATSVKNGYTSSVPISNITQIPNGKIPGHRKTHSAPTKYSNLSNGFLAVNDIFELLSASSQRPIIEEDFHYKRNGKSAMRVASWNLHNLSLEKIENPGVREIFCRTILENRLSVIAVQEVLDNASLQKLCDELNNPTLRRVTDWTDNSREWKCCLLGVLDPAIQACGGLGFLYDSSCQVQLTAMQELCASDTECTVGAVLATFKVRDMSLSILNMYLQDSGINCIKTIEELVQGKLKPRDMLLILGDFTGVSQNEAELNEIQRLQYKSIAPLSLSTNSTDRQLVRYADNIFLNSETQIQFTGVWGIVRQGLTHLAIPRGWMWGGAASEHCPLWCELYTESVLAVNEQ